MVLLTCCQGPRSAVKRSLLFPANLCVWCSYRVQVGKANMAGSGFPMGAERKSELGNSEAFLMLMILCI